MEVNKLHENSGGFHPSSYTLDNRLYMANCIHDLMEETHAGIEHEEHSNLQVLEERIDMEDFGQAFVLHYEDHEPPMCERGFAMEEVVEHMSYGLSRRGRCIWSMIVGWLLLELCSDIMVVPLRYFLGS